MTDSAQKLSQTLHRGLDILEAVAAGCASPAQIAERLSLSRSTTYRLAALLAERGHLNAGGHGYKLGPRMFALGASAARAVDLPRLAQPILEGLTRDTGDAANLGVRDGDEVIYVAQSPGTRRLVVRHGVGARNRLRQTAMGQALMLDSDDEAGETPEWTAVMRQARTRGLGFHRDEFGDAIVCIAAPVRDAAGAIVAAISLSTIPQYLDDERLERLRGQVREAGQALSRRIGGE
ncbi:transcriptional regulator [Caulobacter sp. D4A]|uniref:IclR family transcriptional regulator n=1 Tax=unclassified Caulobacter TaxID=2648921 RepID=UPI000D7281BF|nr:MULTISPECIES: IclR family transcriptional regulator [unclassified Caulobacter]PXA90772.1 transcriptional regulator [Caulobacter sp. D4A]PXA94238.1 transcriptional regulator [Caulobacter sp. D5]